MSIHHGEIELSTSGGYIIFCYKCLGEGCLFCKKSGEIKVNESPKDILKNYNPIYFKCWKILKKYHIFPKEGGVLEQNTCFISAVDVMDTIDIRLARRKEDRVEGAKILLEKGRRLNG